MLRDVHDTLAGDVEGGAVVDRGADHGQAHRDVDAGLDAQDLHRAVALVVVHRHHQVVVAAAGEEERVSAGSGPTGVDAVGLQLDGRGDLLGLLAVAEQTVLAGVRVDGADADPGVGDAGAPQALVAAPDGALDQAGLDLGDGIDQAEWVVTWITLTLGVESIIDTSSIP